MKGVRQRAARVIIEKNLVATLAGRSRGSYKNFLRKELLGMSGKVSLLTRGDPLREISVDTLKGSQRSHSTKHPLKDVWEGRNPFMLSQKGLAGCGKSACPVGTEHQSRMIPFRHVKRVGRT